MQFRIATTETYDPSLCINEWKGRSREFDFLLYISKSLPPAAVKVLTDEKSPWAYMNMPSIVHATITGWGGSELEPNVCLPTVAIERLENLVEAGYPKERIVVRVDPIIPTEEGMKRFSEVVEKAAGLGFKRFRSSIMQMYNHARERLAETSEFKEIEKAYENRFFPSQKTLEKNETVKKLMQCVKLLKFSHGENTFESCATPVLSQCGFENVGCMSEKDLIINGIDPESVHISKGSQRMSCLCLEKRQLIPGGYKRGKCPNRCAYCYIKDRNGTGTPQNQLF